jgi:hypothetical protein
MNGQKNRICRGPPEADEWKKSDFGLQAFGHGFDQYKRVFQDRSIQLDLDTCFGLFSPTETLLPILSFIREW